jgi:hypothetical protein
MARTGKHGRARVRDEEERTRTCALTRRSAEPGELIRFVADPNGGIVPDLALRLPGRGVWLTPTSGAVRQAVRQNVFGRALKREVTAAPELPDIVGELLLKRTIDHLALANKAGLAVAGFARVESAIESGGLFVLLHACDGAEDGRRKLDGKFNHMLGDKGVRAEEKAKRIVAFLTSAELSLAMGRPNVVHAGLNAGGASRKFLTEARRLLRYRLGDMTDAAA